MPSAGYYAETSRTMHRTAAEATRAEKRALKAQHGGTGGIIRVKKDGSEYFLKTVNVPGVIDTGYKRNPGTTIHGWVKARAVKIVRNKRGQAVSVKIKT
jgi:hypothetical protein